MIQEEFTQILDFLEIDPRVVGVPENVSEKLKKLSQEVRELCLVEANLADIILELDEAHNKVEEANPSDNKLPFYSIFIAYAYHAIPDWSWAIEYAKRASTQFRNQEQYWNHAISNWFLGLLFCAYGDFENADINITISINGISDVRKKDYKKTITKILDTHSNLQNRVLDNRVTQFSSHAIEVEEFSKLLRRIVIPSDDLDDDFYIAEQEDVSNLSLDDLISINAYIDNLFEIIQSQLEYSYLADPLINLFLAHCYNLCFFAGDYKFTAYAVEYTKYAIEGFDNQDEIFNQAISSWYLALLYYNRTDQKNSLLKLNEAYHLSDLLIKDNQSSISIDEVNRLQQDLQNSMEIIRSNKKPVQKKQKRQGNLARMFTKLAPEKNKRIDELSSLETMIQPEHDLPHVPESTNFSYKAHASDPSPPPDRTKRKKFFKKREGKLGSIKMGTPDNKNSHPLHIAIPVDVSAFEVSNSSSIFSKGNLFKELQEYNAKLIINSSDTSDGAFQDEEPIHDLDIMIPSFPLYGQATAGPRGEAYLNEILGKIGPIDEMFQTTIEERLHEIYFIDDHQITFIDGRRYGWLQIFGESMNNARNIPIENYDYVLFQENHDLESCTNRIVVALLPEAEPPRLTVKRLRKLSSDIPDRFNGFGAKVQFILESESQYEEDPETGDDFQSEIYVKNDYQIVGNVVAIAKSIEEFSV